MTGSSWHEEWHVGCLLKVYYVTGIFWCHFQAFRSLQSLDIVFLVEGKIFFLFFYTGQQSIWHTADLCSPSQSALKLRLKMAENHLFTWAPQVFDQKNIRMSSTYHYVAESLFQLKSTAMQRAFENYSSSSYSSYWCSQTEPILSPIRDKNSFQMIAASPNF